MDRTWTGSRILGHMLPSNGAILRPITADAGGSEYRYSALSLYCHERVAYVLCQQCQADPHGDA